MVNFTEAQARRAADGAVLSANDNYNHVPNEVTIEFASDTERNVFLKFLKKFDELGQTSILLGEKSIVFDYRGDAQESGKLGILNWLVKNNMTPRFDEKTKDRTKFYSQCRMAKSEFEGTESRDKTHVTLKTQRLEESSVKEVGCRFRGGLPEEIEFDVYELGENTGLPIQQRQPVHEAFDDWRAAIKAIDNVADPNVSLELDKGSLANTAGFGPIVGSLFDKLHPKPLKNFGDDMVELYQLRLEKSAAIREENTAKKAQPITYGR